MTKEIRMTNSEKGPLYCNEADRPFSPYRAENKMQLFGFLPQNASLGFKIRLGGSSLSEEKLGFPSFFFTGANLYLEILFRNTIICFAVVRSDTRPTPYQLGNQSVVHWVLWNLL